jgi:hypothetical protein
LVNFSLALLLKIFNFLLSISLFIAVFNQEKLKLYLSLSSQTLGNNSSFFSLCLLYFFAYSEIIGHHGYGRFIIFAALSNNSQAASSHELQIFSKSHIFFIKKISLCHQETVKHTKGNFISDSFLSKKLANI